MDWLRSEDLKEEKKVTAPMAIITVEEPIALCGCQGLRGTSEQRAEYVQNTSTQKPLIAR